MTLGKKCHGKFPCFLIDRCRDANSRPGQSPVRPKIAHFQSVRRPVQLKSSKNRPSAIQTFESHKVVDAMVADHGQNGCLSGYT